MEKTTKKSISPKVETPKPQERGLGRLSVKMSCERNERKDEWNFKANSAPDAIEEGKRICKANRYRFPQDVVVWDFS